MSQITLPGDDGSIISRRKFLGHCLRGLGVLSLGGLGGLLFGKGAGEDLVWQIDPHKCIGCDLCSKTCVIKPAAVKCVHEYALCGYCDSCFGFFADLRADDTDAAENQRCPTGAISRRFVEQPYFQYVIDEQKCTGCGLCVKGCQTFGNGSLCLQVRHDRCVNCNQCAIATVCPAQAFVRVPARRPYLLRTQG